MFFKTAPPWPGAAADDESKVRDYFCCAGCRVERDDLALSFSTYSTVHVRHHPSIRAAPRTTRDARLLPKDAPETTRRDAVLGGRALRERRGRGLRRDGGVPDHERVVVVVIRGDLGG